MTILTHYATFTLLLLAVFCLIVLPALMVAQWVAEWMGDFFENNRRN